MSNQELGRQMRGDGDVFLSLAQNDDSGENDSFEDAKEDHDSVKAKTPRIPGGFPEPVSPRISNARPRSSGQLLSRRHNASLATAGDSRHARHISQPDRSFVSTETAGLGLDREQYTSKYDLRSPKPELLTRARLENMRAFDGNSEYPRVPRHRTSYSVHPLSAETASRRVSGQEELSDSRSVVVMGNGRGHTMPASAGAGVSPPESDSMESQTAPSTVWDELDELKSRINKLEFSGRLPSSSQRNAPGRTSDRPRPATTAPTTISSTPHQMRKTDFPVSEVTAAGSTISGAQGLLRNALSKAKTTLRPHLFRPLEAAVNDVLALASMTGGDGAQETTAASIVNDGTALSDRQLRRKADSMCRNLTDLCIAICDAQTEGGPMQSSPLSARKSHLGTPPSRYARRSMEPDDDVASHAGSEMRRHASRKSISRLDDFRAARGLSPLISESSDSYQTAERSPRTTPKDYAARYTSGELPESRVGPRLELNGGLDPIARAPSRAMTDVASFRQAAPQRLEHLSSGSQRSPGLRETLAARRASANMREGDTFSEAGGSVVSGYTPASRRLTDRPRGPPSEVGSSVSTSRRRIASMEPYSPSLRVGNPPIRSSSLSQRHMAES